MEFIKIDETLIKSESWPFLLIRQFRFEPGSENPIAEFMKTPLFCWLEYRDQVEITLESGNQLVDWNFHGLYDIKKLRPINFIKIQGVTFIKGGEKFIEEKLDANPIIDQMYTALLDLNDGECEYYLLENLDSDFHHPWTVYDFFLSGIRLDHQHGILTAVEFVVD